MNCCEYPFWIVLVPVSPTFAVAEIFTVYEVGLPFLSRLITSFEFAESTGVSEFSFTLTLACTGAGGFDQSDVCKFPFGSFKTYLTLP